MDEVVCRTCPYFVLTNVQQGECRAGPPTCFVMGGPQGITGAMGMFPPVKPDESWCGRHPDAWRRQALALAKVLQDRGIVPGQPDTEPEALPPGPPVLVKA